MGGSFIGIGIGTGMGGCYFFNETPGSTIFSEKTVEKGIEAEMGVSALHDIFVCNLPEINSLIFQNIQSQHFHTYHPKHEIPQPSHPLFFPFRLRLLSSLTDSSRPHVYL